MFWSGVFITKVVFFCEEKTRTRDFYLTVSLTVLQILDSVYSAHRASVQSALVELKKIENIEESFLKKYLEKESSKVDVFMEIYTLLFIKAIPEKGRRYINYKSWTEASALIEQLRGFMQDGETKR